MSRRFGRQQKRKLLAQVAELGQKLSAAERVGASQALELSRQDQAIQAAREVLGEYWSALPVKVREISRVDEELQLPIPQPFPCSYGYRGNAASLEDSVRFFNFHTAKFDIRRDQFTGEGILRMRVGRSWMVCFAMTRGAFRRQTPERAARCIAESLAWCLVEQTDFLTELKR